jgi:redox-sensitive bicupin YhaK (pirin superfamily)
MTAGFGIAHSEMSPSPHSPILHGAQLWVALPESALDCEPSFESHVDLPRVDLDATTVTVMVGSLLGATSEATAFTPLVGAELALAPHAIAQIPLEGSFEHAVLALTDGVQVNDSDVPSGSMLYVDVGNQSLTVATGASPAIALLLGGEPFEEELVMWWNFVGRTHDDIADARKAWQVERELPPGERSRFGFVEGHDGFTLPAPELPGVELKPRPRHRRN